MAEQAIDKALERARMREYSANIGDALNYKIRLYAKEKSEKENRRVKLFNQ